MFLSIRTGFSRQGASLQNAFILKKVSYVPEAGLAFNLILV